MEISVTGVSLFFIRYYKCWWSGDCSTPCPVNCTDGHCYPGNGKCMLGCKIGQDGDMCDKRAKTL